MSVPDFEALRATVTYEESALMTKEIITTIPVRNPSKLEFIRSREGQEWLFQAYLLNLKDENEKYLIAHNCINILREYGLVKYVLLHTLISSTGILFLSEIPQPEQGETKNSWHQSREEAYIRARKEWVKITASKQLGAYRIFTPEISLPEPEWPANFSCITELLPIAFKDHVIDSPDHPVIKRVRGAV